MTIHLERKSAFLCRQAQKCAFWRRGKSKEGVRGRRGGQPEAPVTTAESTEQPSPTPIAITPRAATVDVLAAAESADSDVHSSSAPHPSPDATQAADILPQYQELYAQNPDLVGWLCIDGTNINYPVVQADNSYYLRRGFDRLYSTAGTLFLDERCRLATPNAAGTANALIYGHNTASGSMFSQLPNYADEAFYTAQKLVAAASQLQHHHAKAQPAQRGKPGGQPQLAAKPEPPEQQAGKTNDLRQNAHRCTSVYFYGQHGKAAVGCNGGNAAGRKGQQLVPILGHNAGIVKRKFQNGIYALLPFFPWRSAAVTKFCPSCSPRVCWPFAALPGC